MSRLRIEALCYRDHGPIDLTIAPAECVTLAGPSGAGKTLLLRAIVDLDPHQGRVLLDDVACADVDAPAWRRRVAMLPAESQWWHDTVGPHFPAAGAGDGARPDTRGDGDDGDAGWLGMLGFAPDVMSWQIARLSTGERQRLALVRLLANRPQALLLDEPTANLDGVNAAKVEAVVARYRERVAAPVLWVGHDPAQETRIAARRFRLEGGRLVAAGA